MTSFLQKTCEKGREKDVVGIVTFDFDLIGLLVTTLVIAYISLAYRSL